MYPMRVRIARTYGREQSLQEPQSAEDVVKMVTEKVFEAFKEFDPDGNGSHVKSDQIKDLLEYIDIKISDQEVYKFLSEIDPEQTGLIEANAFRNIMIEKEIARLCGDDETEILQAYIAMGGDADGGGCVDAEVLIRTIKDEF